MAEMEQQKQTSEKDETKINKNEREYYLRSVLPDMLLIK